MALKRVMLVSVAAVLALALAPTPAAEAAAPVREALVFPEELPLPGGVFCPWEGVVTFPVNREFATAFYDKSGNVTKVLITGSLVVTITNLDNGESVNLNIPGTSVTVDDIVTYRGPDVIFPVSGELNLVNGRVVVTVDSEGFQHPVKIYGSTTDICRLLE
jgi:hypothetical protein